MSEIMAQIASKLARRKAIEAARAGGSIAETAHAAGVTPTTLYRWLKAFDPDRPVASSRPQKRGPKGPRWKPKVVDAVVEIIEHDPALWGRRRVAVALVERGITVSDGTVSRILRAARARLEEQRGRAAHTSDRKTATRMRHEQRRKEHDARREAEMRQWLEHNITPGITREEALLRIGRALSETRWRIGIKDLTPTLRSLADAYRRAVCEQPDLPERDRWLHESYRWPNQDYARVAALNHWAERYRRGPSDAGPTSDGLLPKLAWSTKPG